MHRYLISIGSNTPNRERRVELAIEVLARKFEMVRSTPVYFTDDAWHPNRPPYSNALVEIAADLNVSEMETTLKGIETSMGRDRSIREVAIDIDAVVCDGEILRRRDYNAPYFTLGLSLLNQPD